MAKPPCFMGNSYFWHFLLKLNHGLSARAAGPHGAAEMSLNVDVHNLINRMVLHSIVFPIWDKVLSIPSSWLRLWQGVTPRWELRSVLWLPSSGVSAQCDANVSVACLKQIHASLLQVCIAQYVWTVSDIVYSWVFKTKTLDILILLYPNQRVSSAEETWTSAGQLARHPALFLLGSAERTAF